MEAERIIESFKKLHKATKTTGEAFVDMAQSMRLYIGFIDKMNAKRKAKNQRRKRRKRKAKGL